MEVECPDCGAKRKHLGKHLAQASCEYPSFTDRQKEILTGLILGDGCVSRRESHKNPCIEVNMTNKKFLSWLDKEFPIHGKGVVFRWGAEKSAEGENWGKPENYNDVYGWRTMSTPELRWLADWYTKSDKEFPEKLSLEPLMVKVWYVCDGGITHPETNTEPYVKIHSYSQDLKKIANWFKDVGLDPRIDKGSAIRFTEKGSKEFWDWIGDPIDGYKYKWPEGHNAR